MNQTAHLNTLKRMIAVVTFALFCVFSSQSMANSIFNASVAVDDRSDASRAAGLSSALRQVLSKVSGMQDFTAYANLEAAIAKPQKFVYQFAFQDVERIDMNGELLNSLRLDVQFQPQLVRKLLKQAQAPIWNGRRPNLVLGMVLDDGRSPRAVLRSDPNSYRSQTVRDLATERGLTLVLPDVESQNYQLDDIWSLDRQANELTRVALKTTLMLTAKGVQDSRGLWYGSWLLNYDGEFIQTDINASDLNQFLAQGMEFAATYLFDRFAVTGSSEVDDAVVLQVRQVSNYQEYHQVRNDLLKLVLISSVRVRDVMPDAVVFEISTDSDLEQLKRLILQSKRLRESEIRDEDSDANLMFDLIKESSL